jgi:hypothetical protein
MEISKERLEKYFKITKEAFELAKNSDNRTELLEQRADIMDMVERYIKDAEHFYSEGRVVDAFACLNYAHGWLDCGARLGIFDVHDSRLFTVD